MFKESRQRFGANKIAAVLSERGIKTTPKYVAELMREMGIEGIVTSTFKHAFTERGHPQQLIFHSNRGAQYTSNALRKLLRMNKVVQSFSKSGSPYDNAVAEAFSRL